MYKRQILTIALPDTHHGVTKCTRATVEIGDKVGVSAHTLNNWLKPSGPSHGVEGSSGELADDELKRLRRENKELRRANEILKTASAFFAAELDRPTRR